ncbi:MULTISPECIES: flagellar export chaperone FliS [Thermotoga]|uniref:Flagellar secretion chaperone FliS n=1 Tax=Thermotoga neapolitana (strain ATCC 49049 / DSM 4359 / NBRC 107923 / NS-E) TaxID=309803 RepID=B9K9E0_THENN|nr:MULTISPECIES: flagellar export chaperone FliS [Thermotoga]MDK2786683.1 flagellar secretion chaperone FliS [Thermotoga sp.]HBF10328.1 flagellar export chaperone FliS [Thermotoga neapolitana]ACM23573.1 Flagellar protein FliS [Thermotoga neapolitana DSM 4359]AJG41469.1 flagellar biosynthesis protein FliS [Thermotoga sp. RQ7]KFZ21201.1 flagellar protein FliS [Thermotoga neapolitana LA10]
MKENTYLEKMVMTASPAKLVQMLYEKAIEVLKEAEKLLEEKKFVEFSEKITRAQDIITELNLSLDMEKGGTIAQNLRALYNYMFQRLVEGNVKKDLEKIREVEGMLSELLEVWKEAMKKAGNITPSEKKQGGLNLMG